jgi:hypothetical protein
MKKHILALQCFLASNAYGYTFVPATKFQATVAASVESSSSGFKYSYQVTSTSSSQQNIFEVFIDLNKTSVDGVSPTGWEFAITGGADSTHRGYWAQVVIGNDILPGNTRGGFAMKSPFPPAIGPMFLRGNAPIPSYDDAEGVPDGVFPLTPYDDAVVIPTLVPSSFTVTGSTASIAFLIGLKHQAHALGWITSIGIVKSLDAKLDAAQAALARGNKTTAANQLRAFINELEAQRGKKVNENAYYLLNLNADFIIGKLEHD